MSNERFGVAAGVVGKRRWREPSMTRAGTAALNNSNRDQEISEHRIAKGSEDENALVVYKESCYLRWRLAKFLDFARPRGVGLSLARDLRARDAVSNTLILRNGDWAALKFGDALRFDR
jgi:hypothetical protein